MSLFGTVENFVPTLPTSPLPTPPNSGDGYPPMEHPNPEYNHYKSGRNVNGSGIQKSGDVTVRDHSPTTGVMNLGSICSNKGNDGRLQLVGDVKIGKLGY